MIILSLFNDDCVLLFQTIGKQAKEENILWFPIYNSRKYKLIHRAREQLSGYLGNERAEQSEKQRLQGDDRDFGGVMDVLTVWLWWLHCVYICQNIRFYTLNMYTLLCVDYSLIELFTKIWAEMNQLLGGPAITISTF